MHKICEMTRFTGASVLCNVVLASIGLIVTTHNTLAQSVITTVAGTDFSIPDKANPLQVPIGGISGLASDKSGNIFFSRGHIVFRLSKTNELSIYAGNQGIVLKAENVPALDGYLDYAADLAFDPAGNLYIADTAGARVHKIDLSGNITTFAGGGGQRGDGGPATNGSFGGASSVAADAAGNVYVHDSGGYHSIIRKIDKFGTITTYAGTGPFGFSGDGGPAIKATLGTVVHLAIDVKDNNLLIADGGNCRIRKIDAAGIIKTIAGLGGCSTSDASNFGGDGGQASGARLSVIQGITTDSKGNIYFCDYYNYRIRKISTEGVITTIAGNGRREFSGDGGMATTAGISAPQNVTVDPEGALLIADGTRIRKVAPSGIITTVAGNGYAEFSGDGLPALTVAFTPSDVAVDRAGNLYVAGGSMIRKITTDGVMHTIAGSSTCGYSGDGGDATKATLCDTKAVKIDSLGNLYIAEYANNRIRKILPNGTIVTIAGGGSSYAESVPATSAALRGPMDIALDSSGNLFIADTYNYRVRKVTPDGIIRTVAGNGKIGSSGDGGLAIQASFSQPAKVAVDPRGNLLISDQWNYTIRSVGVDGVIRPLFDRKGFFTCLSFDASGNLYFGGNGLMKMTTDGKVYNVGGFGTTSRGDGGDALKAHLVAPRGVAIDASGNIFVSSEWQQRIRKILAKPPTSSISRPDLRYIATAGGPLPVRQRIPLDTGAPGMAYSVTISTDDGGNWLGVDSNSGVTPAALGVIVSPSGLAPGVYHGSVKISFPLAAPTVQTIAVTFSVNPTLPGKLIVSAPQLSFSTSRDQVISSTVMVSNFGGGALTFQVTTSGGDWLKCTPDAGSVTPGRPVTINVLADPASLEAGTYAGVVTVLSAGTGEQVDTPVTMVVRPSPSRLVLSQSGVSFRAASGSGNPSAQRVDVLNAGLGSMSWSASATTYSGGNWLIVTPLSGIVGGPLVDAGEVTVSVNSAGMGAGDYYGQIIVTSSDNDSRTVEVVLRVAPPDSVSIPDVRPAGAFFLNTTGRIPPSRSVSVYNLNRASTSFNTVKLTLDDKEWFQHLPSAANVLSGQTQRIIVQPDPKLLIPGVHTGSLTLVFGDSYQVIKTTSVVAGANCVPSRLLILATALQQVFEATWNLPVPIEVEVVDDCARPLTGDRKDSSVIVSLSNGDRPIMLRPVGGGRWSGTWQPRLTGDSQVFLTVTAALLLEDGTVASQRLELQANVGGELRVPVVFGAKGVDPESIEGVIVPGSAVAITGMNFTGGSPLEVRIGDTLLNVTFLSDTEIDVDIPANLPPDREMEIIINRGAAVSLAELVVVGQPISGSIQTVVPTFRRTLK